MTFPIQRLFLLALGVLLSLQTVAQSDFEGTITYSIEYLTVPDEVKGMESMLPQEARLQFKGQKVRMVQEVMGGSQTVISDGATKEGLLLMDMMGQKIAVSIPQEATQAEEEAAKNTTVTELTRVKKILGHKCKEYEITAPDGSKVYVFSTKALGNIKHQQYKQLDGFPLEYITAQQGMKIRMEATNIEKESLGDELFDAPEGYQHMTLEELQQLGM